MFKLKTKELPSKGVVDALGKNWAGIATRKEKLTDIITMGFFPKPNYEQIGTFNGDVSGLEKGDKVAIVYKEKFTFLDYLLMKSNIEKLQKIHA